MVKLRLFTGLCFALNLLANLPGGAQGNWRHALALHPPDVNLLFWTSDHSQLRNNPQSVRLAYQGAYREAITFVVDAGPADPPPLLRGLAGRYRGLDLGLGILVGAELTQGYWMGFGTRLGYARCAFDFDGYSLAPSGNFYVALGEGRGSLRQIGVEGQWVNRWLPKRTPLFLEATIGLEVGGRGMFSAQELFPNGSGEGELLAPNEYHAFMSGRLRLGIGWRLGWKPARQTSDE